MWRRFCWVLCCCWCAGPLYGQDSTGAGDAIDVGRAGRISSAFFVAPLVVKEGSNGTSIFDVELETGLGGGLTYTVFQNARRDRALVGLGLGVILNSRDGTFYDATPTLMLTILNNRVGLGYGYFTGHQEEPINRHRGFLSLGLKLD